MTEPSTLVIGFGNPDRQDDGVAWHILAALADHFGIEKPRPPDLDFYPAGTNPDLLFCLQLSPEQAEIIANYERVCFVDAHTGSVANDLNWQVVEPRFQTSPLTHHMTPETLLSLTKSLYHRQPQAVLVSVRGYEFEFSHLMSQRTTELALQAAQKIITWWENP
jgi:hydrogenase maturation protease